MREELFKHLEEVAEKYYAGNVEIVDEFLQLYCLGEEARKKCKEETPELWGDKPKKAETALNAVLKKEASK